MVIVSCSPVFIKKIFVTLFSRLIIWSITFQKMVTTKVLLVLSTVFQCLINSKHFLRSDYMTWFIYNFSSKLWNWPKKMSVKSSNKCLLQLFLVYFYTHNDVVGCCLTCIVEHKLFWHFKCLLSIQNALRGRLPPGCTRWKHQPLCKGHQGHIGQRGNWGWWRTLKQGKPFNNSILCHYKNYEDFFFFSLKMLRGWS